MYSPLPCCLSIQFKTKEEIERKSWYSFLYIQYCRYNSARIKNSDLTETGSKGSERHTTRSIKVHLNYAMSREQRERKIAICFLTSKPKAFSSPFLLTEKDSKGSYYLPFWKYDKGDSRVMAWVTNREMWITQWVASPIHSDKQDGADSNQGKKRLGGLESWTEPRKVVISTWTNH